MVEVAFVASFQDSDVRRVWPGQPSSRSPWSPTPDGCELVLDALPDAEAATTTAGWLRFLAREFLAPRTEASLALALRNGLTGGHRLTGRVLLDGVREITVSNNRVNERVLQHRPDADVFELDDRRRAHNTDR
ncbi:hypothetical protein NSZ01_36660 [Nocardioides szechwanensis]|uniref:Uncharacterized protein n=1 Tax=Nocardioides szechwanensis TaxID=1005944 RepID=A0A1G9ZNT3_9ACTN|nr:hypothetical protein NSZ01_36660 [Nocardioides szechwanensis]SDN23162.1 hypothetical protein SAMN05192576_1801 [Nocardioides szechwanensis]